MGQFDSFFIGNVIIARHGEEPLFAAEEGGVFCRLRQYAILPIEHYEALQRAADEASTREAAEVIKRIKKNSMETKE